MSDYQLAHECDTCGARYYGENAADGCCWANVLHVPSDRL